MNWATICWSMAAAASLTPGLVHLMAWWQNREKSERLWFFFVTVATAGMTFTELAMMKATTAAEYGSAPQWNHLPVWLNSIAVAGFVPIHLRAGRLWLAALALAMRTITLGINFALPPALNFRELTGLRMVPFPGEEVALAVGPPSPWMLRGHRARCGCCWCSSWMPRSPSDGAGGNGGRL